MRLLILLFIPFTAFPQLKVATFNIRFYNPADGENSWIERKTSVQEFLEFHHPDVIGFQEALHVQVHDLEAMLPGMVRIGVGRDDGGSKGEYVPLFYDSVRFDLLDSGAFWLSETPNIPSTGWDAALPRVCSFATLQDQAGKVFTVINIHFDHVGQEARSKSAELLIQKTQNFDHPVIVMGDFNLEPQAAPIRQMLNVMKDSFDEADIRFGNIGTFNGFNNQVNANNARRIDYIFFNAFDAPASYEVVSHVIDGHYLSDHFPVVVVFNR